MEEQGDQEAKSIPIPIPFDDHSSKEEPDMEEVDEEEEKTNSSGRRSHVCEHCGKQFGSGKALGGHKRIHFQSAKRDLRKKYKSKRVPNKPNLGSPEGDDVIHRCTICGKDFGSVKALYGHLRLHPDRPWRGATNQLSPLRYNDSSPNNPNPNPSWPIETKIEEKKVDLSNYPRITLSVDMTSWTSPNISGPASASRVEAEQDTAGILLLLACENPLSDNKGKKRRFLDPEEKKKKKSGDHEIRVSKEEEKKKKKVYICYPCNKSFNSHQAYGGHVSSHNKSSSKTNSSSSPKIESTPQSITSRSEVAPSSELDQPSRQRVLNIDLNELPPVEEDEEEEEVIIKKLASCVHRNS